MEKVNWGYVFLVFILCVTGLAVPLVVMGALYLVLKLAGDALGDGHNLPGDGDGSE